MAKNVERAKVQRYSVRLIEVLGVLLLITVVGALFVWALKFILPFVLGALLALLFLPLVRWLERLGLSRMLAVWIGLVGVLLIVLVLSALAVIAIAAEATALSANLPQYFSQLQHWAQHQMVVGKVFYSHLPPQVVSAMQSKSSEFLSGVEKGFQAFTTTLLNLVTQLPDWIFIIAMALIATFFLLVDRDRLYQGFMHSLPPGWDKKITVTFRDMAHAFVGTIRVQFIIMALSAALAMLGMWVLGIQYAFILGILFGITGIIPLIGSFILTVPWALGALLTGDTSLTIKVIAIQVVITAIVHLITPKITANSIGLDTLSTLFSLYAGMKAVGFIGLFIGPIVLIGIKSLLKKRLFVDLFPSMKRIEEKTRMKVEQQENSGTNRGEPL